MKVHCFSMILVIAILAGMLGFHVLPVNAMATFAVNTTTDGADAVPGNCICATSGGLCTVRAAIQEANACAGADTINLGGYNYQVPDASFTITQNLTIVGTDATLSGIANGNANRLFTVNSGVTLTLEHVRIYSSGGIINNGTLYVYDSDFEANSVASAHGGALLNNGAAIIDDGYFEDNYVTGTYNGGALYNNGILNLTDSIFSGNSANNGGAIYNSDYGDFLIANTRVLDNSATVNGGGLYLGGYYCDNDAILFDVIIRNNNADNGGNIFVTDLEWSLIDSSVTLGLAYEQGGGIFQTTQADCTHAWVTNTTISGNAAYQDGGGIFVGANSNMDLFNVTISDNFADWDFDGVGDGVGAGGGIYNVAPSLVEFRNTIIAGNNDRSPSTPPLYPGVDPDCYGALFSRGYNLVGRGTCTINGSTQGLQNGSKLFPIQAGLTDLFQDLTSGQYYHDLTSISPAIDRGNPAGCVDRNGDLIDHDQLNENRPHGWYCDLGAIESAYRLNRVTLPAVLR